MGEQELPGFYGQEKREAGSLGDLPEAIGGFDVKAKQGARERL